ncbi:MAG: hypothetical protein IJC89_04470 [Clostridia bacterium]|nr:hypothetical protein [Clostridia bacterium]
MKTKITVSAFVIMLAIFAVLTLMPGDPDSVIAENREPAQMPEVSLNNIFFGDFCSDYESFLSDDVGFRGKLISLSNKINSLKGIKGYGYISNANADLGLGAGDTKKGLLIADEKIMEIFKANAQQRDNYADMVSHYRNSLPDDIYVYSMIIPTQIEFEGDEYKSLSDSQKETIDYIYNKVDSRVKCVNAYDALKNHKNEYIYFRTDHHWTTLGAYYAYREFAQTAKVNIANIKDYEEKKAEGFLGYLYNQAQATELKEKPDTIYYYEKEGQNLTTYATAWENGEVIKYQGKIFSPAPAGTETKYSLFMGGDHPLLYIPTNVENGRHLMIIKDSYANAFIPWVINSFETVVVCDPRSFGTDIMSVAEEYGITDVLLMNYTFTTTFPDIISLEKGIMQ